MQQHWMCRQLQQQQQQQGRLAMLSTPQRRHKQRALQGRRTGQDRCSNTQAEPAAAATTWPLCSSLLERQQQQLAGQ
jgi:hypothetical protein